MGPGQPDDEDEPVLGGRGRGEEIRWDMTAVPLEFRAACGHRIVRCASCNHILSSQTRGASSNRLTITDHPSFRDQRYRAMDRQDAALWGLPWERIEARPSAFSRSA